MGYSIHWCCYLLQYEIKKKKKSGVFLLLYRCIPFFLLPLVAEFLSFYVFPVSSTRQAATGNLACFSEGGTVTQDCGFSLAHRPWPVFWVYLLSELTLPSALGTIQEELPKCVFSTWGIEDAYTPNRETFRWDTPRGSQVDFLPKPGMLTAGMHPLNALWYPSLPLS